MHALRAQRQQGGAGELAIVLHAHMPYVEGYGTWPFGEEWLHEAIARCYLPLLELLEEGAPLTLSLTPVLCDQLEAPGLADRFKRFVREVRAHTHKEDACGLRAAGQPALAAELERCQREYEQAVAQLDAHQGDLLAALGPHVRFTSAATHAILPLVASDALARVQVQSGVRAHRARFGAHWRGGFWLPECAHAPHIEPILAEAGARVVCVEWTQALGAGAIAHLRPYAGVGGLVLVPIDRLLIDRVWGAQGYPAHGVYRDTHRRTVHNHNPWANDGSAYDHDRALAQAQRDARDFAGALAERLRAGCAALGEGALVVVAADAELFGLWWYEGVAFLRALAAECRQLGLTVAHLDQASALSAPPAPLPSGAEGQAQEEARAGWPTSWGTAGDLRTWSTACAEVRAMASATRAAELELLRRGAAAGGVALRELLALQASDWAFMVARGEALPYARERFAGHRRALCAALAGAPGPPPRNLARFADVAMLELP
ncbi:MAG TPA: 1,4-alpha-glucan branching protein domain-containing protein [Solirubrobacteraceae bacterium]|nr:1,4-alpha-glucan branching protein domain-containing protein [Solirubrobacteraceae bacterium]